jgi:arsenate reductase
MVIYYNPRCSKCRQALALCEEYGADFETVEYLKDPLTRERLAELLDGLGGDIELMTRAADLEKAGLTPSLDLLAERPEFLQRPIILKDGRVAVARTPEAVKEILES